MNRATLEKLSRRYRDRLLHDTLPFWIDHCIDRKHGGYLTYLDRDGSVLCTDKSMWIQGRFAWLLARLYNSLERREQWLELSRQGLEFIRRHGFAPDGRMYYWVTAEGEPLRREPYPFTECFAVLAFAEYARAAADSGALAEARRLFARVLEMHARPGSGSAPSVLSPEGLAGTRQTRIHALSMILIGTLQVLRLADPNTDYGRTMDGLIDELFRLFVKPERRALLEVVSPDGGILDCPEGRCVNPGHALETGWFLLEEARSRQDEGLLRRVLPLIDWSLERGWDRKHGGILYFVDIDGKPPAPLEWDMKLWWPHNEGLYATQLAWALTGERRYERWFGRIQEWALQHFPDRRYGEWYGYLHRDGTVASLAKGNNRKGPYHLPRQQLLSHLLFKEMATA